MSGGPPRFKQLFRGVTGLWQYTTDNPNSANAVWKNTGSIDSSLHITASDIFEDNINNHIDP
ncbi:hypothetical protein FACS189413_18240 [Bacteroidia bacterium]|nr:hypothetical protein FACS189413_18240 [Bacteroidia bacterium]